MGIFPEFSKNVFPFDSTFLNLTIIFDNDPKAYNVHDSMYLINRSSSTLNSK